MRLMRFTAPDMAQAMRQVRQALGPDAVILSTSRVSGGGVEITAAVDEPLAPVGGGAGGAGASPSPVPGGGQPAGESGGAALSALARRVEGLAEMLSKHMVVSEAAAGFAARPEVAPIYHHLMGQEVSPAVINELLTDLAAAGGQGLAARLAIRLKKMLNVAGGRMATAKRPAVWALVGPTGVGKTTTAAKLAANFALRHRLKVGLVTVDTYRIAAAEQIEVYGRIMEIPTVVAGGAEDLRRALEGMAELDLVLVDTVGRSPKDEENLEELRAVLEGAPGLTTHLVLACPTRDADKAEVLAAFARFAPQSLIFTKLDETATYGPILNQVVRSGLPVSYLTCGQRVPEDLEEATREGLAKRLLPPRRGMEI
jgi:flagellar biosynthesis protein FlhF